MTEEQFLSQDILDALRNTPAEFATAVRSLAVGEIKALREQLQTARKELDYSQTVFKEALAEMRNRLAVVSDEVNMLKGRRKQKITFSNSGASGNAVEAIAQMTQQVEDIQQAQQIEEARQAIAMVRDRVETAGTLSTNIGGVQQVLPLQVNWDVANPVHGWFQAVNRSLADIEQRLPTDLS